MQTIAAFATLLALAAAAPGEQSYGKDTYPKKDCHTTQTCKAVYTTYYKDVPTYYETTKTVTSYTPYTTTTYIDK